MKASELANLIGATLSGSDINITRCATLDEATSEEVSFLTNYKYASNLQDSSAGAVILSSKDAQKVHGKTLLIADDPYFAFRQAVVQLHGFARQPKPGISDLASVHPSAKIGENVHIAPFVVVEADAVIGARTTIHPRCTISQGAVLGENCILYSGVIVYRKCILGNRVTLHAGCSIGQDGFGYATHQGVHHKIPQTGIARIEDDVEMGANCSVDRATLGQTVVGAGSKFSNSVTIGHGTKVGRHNLFVAQVGLAGSVQTGDYVAMGGQVGVAGHLKIGNKVQIAATSGVMQDVPDSAQVGGTPATSLGEAFRVHANVQRLPKLAATVKKMGKRIAELEKQLQKTD